MSAHRRSNSLERAAKAVDLVEKIEDHVDALVVYAHRTPEIENELRPDQIDGREAPIVPHPRGTKPAVLDPGIECRSLDSKPSAQLRCIEHQTPNFSRGL